MREGSTSWHRLLALVLGTCVAFTIVETSFRVSSLEHSWFLSLLNVVVDHRCSTDPELLYELHPRSETAETNDRSWGRVHSVAQTNEMGFRDRPRTVSKTPETTRIVCLGGSNTYGAGVTQGLTWPAQLERQLARTASGSVEVWNLGVSGYVNRQKAALGQRALREFEPDLFLVQIHNTGRRSVALDGGVQEVEQLVSRFPSLHHEYLVSAPRPGSGIGWSLWRACATWRCVTIALNGLLWNKPDGGADVRTHDRADARNDEALERFFDSAAGHAGIFVVYPATGYPVVEFLDGRCDHGVIDLQERLPDAWRGMEEYEDIHPSRRAFEWYAAEIAATIVEAGCLTDPVQCARQPDCPPGG